MIIAIGVGVMIIFTVLLLVILNPGEAPKNKTAVMDDTLEYLKKGEGILSLKTFPEENRVLVIYDSYQEKKFNFVKIARYAAIKLSHQMGDLQVSLVLAKDSKDNPTYSFVLKRGRVISEGPIGGEKSVEENSGDEKSSDEKGTDSN